MGPASPGGSVGHVGGELGLEPAPALTSQEIAQGQHDDAGGRRVHEEPAGQPHPSGHPGQVGQDHRTLAHLTRVPAGVWLASWFLVDAVATGVVVLALRDLL